jgi:hypothetical protein
MARDVSQQKTPHIRFLERARERDGEPAIDHKGAQHLRGIIAAYDVWR